jgi:hypothetical protein
MRWDAELPSVLDFISAIAFVRAKVACFRLDDPTVPAGEKAARAAARYIQLAASYAKIPFAHGSSVLWSDGLREKRAGRHWLSVVSTCSALTSGRESGHGAADDTHTHDVRRGTLHR